MSEDFNSNFFLCRLRREGWRPEALDLVGAEKDVFVYWNGLYLRMTSDDHRILRRHLLAPQIQQKKMEKRDETNSDSTFRTKTEG